MGDRFVRFQSASRCRWQEQGTAAAVHFLFKCTGSSHAAHLLRRNLSSSTQAAYQNHWEVCVRFFELDEVSSLPATPVTASRYAGNLCGKGTIRGVLLGCTSPLWDLTTAGTVYQTRPSTHLSPQRVRASPPMMPHEPVELQRGQLLFLRTARSAPCVWHWRLQNNMGCGAGMP